MDSRLFSRDSSPPPLASQQAPLQAPYPTNPHNSPPNQIDSLFHHLSASADHQSEPYTNSAPSTPVMSSNDEQQQPQQPVSSPVSSSTNADRQSALLSLLSPPTNPRGPVPVVPNPQQVPTPPSASGRSDASPSHNEAQGKILLEQLMSGNAPMSAYSDTQRGGPANASPPYATNQRDGDYRSYQHEASPDLQQRTVGPTQQQQQPPSPRKSLFDFVSPFDALASSTSTGSIKKKPVPPSVSSGTEESGWTNLSDPKRQSVDNLLEHLTRGAPTQVSAPPAYDGYLAGGDFSQSESSRAPAHLPPKNVPMRTASPRASPPKTQAQRARVIDSPASQSSQPAGNGGTNNRRDKESSPGPRGGYRKGPGQAKGNKNTNQSPSPQTQNIIFDVSQPLDEIQASRDAVKSTAIALVKQDAVFLSGTTIGATHWVAYAMTRGRVRVISRSSGDRTLLQLPSATFPNTSSVTDMAVYGNRLAGVTSDGGFVVWELPEVITDDVPGHILLCVAPVGLDSSGSDALHSVKWHPKEPDTLAVASQSKVYLIDLSTIHSLRGGVAHQSDLIHISQVFPIPSPLVAFDFDILHYALATISEDSSLIIWNIHDRLPYTTHKIRGEDAPSSLTYVDGGIVVGRKNGTIFQLLSMTSKSVLSTIKFVNGAQEDPDMFGHVSYDSRIQTLWVANCRRDSMIALKIHLEPSMVGGEEAIRGYIDQVVEFAGPKPTIHFVILTADADPNGDEAHAACVAAKLVPGELALVAFSVHSSGVDQILIRKEWFETALSTVPAKFPAYDGPPPVAYAPPAEKARAPISTILSLPVNPPPHQRPRTPPSEDGETDMARDEARLHEGKAKGGKGKNVNWKEKDDNGKDKDKNPKNSDAALINDSALGQALSREIRKMEESLHTRVGRLIGKEMDKQHQRLEEARAHDQAEDFARQEKILKLISTELTRNTTRVVEMAVKSEVQNSVLPALENITKQEVKAALNEQVSSGFVDYISQSLPIEIEKLLLRPDISAHFAQVLSANLTPVIDRHMKDTVAKALLPAVSQQSSSMHQELLRELRGELHGVKAELSGWQGEAFRNQEASIRELEHAVRTLSEQVKFLGMNPGGPVPPNTLHQFQPQQLHNSPGPSVQHPQPTNIPQPPFRQQNLPPGPQGPNYPHNFPQQPPPPVMQPAWYGNIAAPQASHPAQLPQPPPQPTQERTPPIKPDQWDDIYLGVLHTQDLGKLRELLAHTNPEQIMPLNGPTLVSQAVLLTLVHRLSATISELPPNDESFKTALWWLQRTSALLRPEDKLITDFIPRVLPGVQTSLVATKQRLPLAAGGPPTLEVARSITEVQEILRRKMGPVQ